MLLRDRNAGVDDEIMDVFYDTYCLMSNVIKQLACFKNLMKLSCTDLILSNKPQPFQATRFSQNICICP